MFQSTGSEQQLSMRSSAAHHTDDKMTDEPNATIIEKKEKVTLWRDEEKANRLRKCEKCNILQPIRTKHCRHCDRCVDRYGTSLSPLSPLPSPSPSSPPLLLLLLLPPSLLFPPLPPAPPPLLLPLRLSPLLRLLFLLPLSTFSPILLLLPSFPSL